MAEGARFKATPASETIGSDRVQSVHSQPHNTDESEAGEKPIKSDQAE